MSKTVDKIRAELKTMILAIEDLKGAEGTTRDQFKALNEAGGCIVDAEIHLKMYQISKGGLH